jgi:hypothetical protein
VAFDIVLVADSLGGALIAALVRTRLAVAFDIVLVADSLGGALVAALVRTLKGVALDVVVLGGARLDALAAQWTPHAGLVLLSHLNLRIVLVAVHRPKPDWRLVRSLMLAQAAIRHG